MKIEDFIKLTEERYSCRNYSGRDISDKIINNCIEAARLSPSACNKQPWRFLIVKDQGLREKICDNALLPGISMPWLRTAPIIAIICADTSIITHKIAPILSGVNYYMVDLGIAGEHFVLAAKAQNIDTCWIGWFKEKQIKKILRIPGSIKVVSLISMGYSLDENGKQPEKMKIDKIHCYNYWEMK